MADIEIERKYVIEKPSIADMAALSDYSFSHITQTYLESLPGITHRVRKREYSDGRVQYTETVKRRIDKTSAYEDEREISVEEYTVLLEKVKTGTRSLSKIRHTFVYSSQVFEIDVYPEWELTCIMETELMSSEDKVVFPDFLKIIKEVTGERIYSNAAMAGTFPPELL